MPRKKKTEEAVETPKKKKKRKHKKPPKPKPQVHKLGDSDIVLSDREQLIFKLLEQRRAASTDDILTELDKRDMKISAKRGSHSLGVLMKYLTAKACQEGFIISMVGGGRGAGNKAAYSMAKRF